MKIIGVIPARMESTRFPGKPLELIAGKPMLVHVCERAAAGIGWEQVFVATDSDEIKEVVTKADFQIVMTGDAKTGTDRVAQVAAQTKAEIYVNIQCDEPTINPEGIRRVAWTKINNMDRVICGVQPLLKGELENTNVVKAVFHQGKRPLVYMSRQPVPTTHKQVGVYAFTPKELAAFAAKGVSDLEEREGIEVLRCLDMDMNIGVCELPGNAVSVNVIEDIAVAEKELELQKLF